jgi:hypothetical protein
VALARARDYESNHFHLALETPLGNLVAGMQWLQSTFANRFNKLRDVHGHLFQGRYKSLRRIFLFSPSGILQRFVAIISEEKRVPAGVA